MKATPEQIDEFMTEFIETKKELDDLLIGFDKVALRMLKDGSLGENYEDWRKEGRRTFLESIRIWCENRISAEMTIDQAKSILKQS